MSSGAEASPSTPSVRVLSQNRVYNKNQRPFRLGSCSCNENQRTFPIRLLLCLPAFADIVHIESLGFLSSISDEILNNHGS